MNIRSILMACTLTILAACGSDRDDISDLVAVRQAGTGPARLMFGHVDAASDGRARVYGGYARGCVSGAEQLPETGDTWQAMRLARNRNWSHPDTLDFVQDLSRFAATQPGWAGLYIGDMSQPRGGPMLTGHASHQSGLDADIWMLPPDRLNLTRDERENLSAISMRRNRGAYVNDSWTPEHAAILREAASDPRVARIFLFPGAKVWMCDNETGNRDYLRQIRPWYGHHYHFHVRLNCPRNSSDCVEQSPPPAGDGCEEAREWQRNILNPPPPPPDDNRPPTVHGEITLSDLPAQCTRVLTAGP